MTGLVIWIGLNDWDVEKSLDRLKVPTAEVDNTVNKQPETPVEITEPDEVEEKPEIEPSTDVEKPNLNLDAGGYIPDQLLPVEATYIDGILIASKKYPLPSTFALGEDKEARAAFNEMAAEAALSGFKLTAFSTYRSFDYQTELYERYVNRDGKEAADRYSARPGYSEHQTGLAFDIGEVNFEKHWASSTFGDTEAGKWVALHAHKYGFIMRYPLGKEDITGYMHESWHYRYVGPEIAEEIFNKKITLEEYLEI